MHRVRILHISPGDAIDLKNQLIRDGLVIDHDFTWAYRQASYDNDGFTTVDPKQVTFDFIEASLATFYQLKWIR